MKSKSVVLILVILGCIGFIYYGIQQVNLVIANDFDNLELVAQPISPEKLRDFERSYQSPSETQLEIQIDKVLNHYPATIISLHHPRKYLVIHIDGWMTEGTDSACEAAAECFHELTGLGLTLEVQGKFVPSVMNPMDRDWTTYLVGETDTHPKDRRDVKRTHI